MRSGLAACVLCPHPLTDHYSSNGRCSRCECLCFEPVKAQQHLDLSRCALCGHNDWTAVNWVATCNNCGNELDLHQCDLPDNASLACKAKGCMASSSLRGPCQSSCALAANSVGDDPINHPSHYTQHPSGVECIEIAEHMNYCRGNAMKYLWRAGLKGENAIEDLRKAAWYIDREIKRLEDA